MLDHILNTAQNFERIHGIKPDVIYINPLHYESLRRLHSGLFHPEQEVDLGFRLVILPGSVLSHPEAAQLSIERRLTQVA